MEWLIAGCVLHLMAVKFIQPVIAAAYQIILVSHIHGGTWVN